MNKFSIAYWTSTGVFSALIALDGIGGITHQKAGIEALQHLGYPEYLMSITGIAKLLAVIALLQTKYPVIKEWAFAGLAFNFIGAAMSHYYLHDDIMKTIFPLIFLAIMYIPYFLWKRKQILAVQYDLPSISHSQKSND